MSKHDTYQIPEGTLDAVIKELQDDTSDNPEIGYAPEKINYEELINLGAATIAHRRKAARQ